MYCRFLDLKEKEVININDGSRLGYVGDIEIDTHTGNLISIIIFGRKWLRLFGKNDDLIIKWNDIEVIGEETILVTMKVSNFTVKDNTFFPKFLNHS